MSLTEAAVVKGFTHSLQSVFGPSLERFPQRVAVALSGGVDSMALLSLLVDLKRKRMNKLQIDAITVDHGIRPESKQEVQDLHKAIEPWPVDHHVLEINEKIDPSQLEKIARDLRYKMMLSQCEKLPASYLFMGHHRDDQMETFLMRLKNNSTMFGLRSMRPKSDYPLQSPVVDLDVIRPLLQLQKSQLVQYCEEKSIPWFQDPTNFIPELTQRNLYRHMLRGEMPPAITKDKILDSLKKVQSFNENIESDVDSLNAMQLTQFDPKTLSLKIQLSRDLADQFGYLALDRWLYLQLQRVSPSSHYFHDFTKVDNKYANIGASGKKQCSLSEDLLSGSRPSKFALMNCQFEWDGSTLTVYRALEPRTQDYQSLTFSMPLGETEWLDFDHRVFVKFHNQSQANCGDCTLENYRSQDHLQWLKDAFKDPDQFKPLLKYNVPVLLKNNSILGFPTLNRYADKVPPLSLTATVETRSR